VRLEVEALSEQWAAARAARDYTTADAIRARVRKAGFDPEDMVEELATYGRTAPNTAPSESKLAGPHGPLPAAALAEEQEDPLAYRPTVVRTVEWGPTDAAKNHKDGGTGGLLTLNYQSIEPLPPDIGFTVTSGSSIATKDPLLAYKRLQQEEEERTRREINERNSMARARPGTGR